MLLLTILDRKFWTMIKHFLTNRGIIKSNEIDLTQGEDIINNDAKVTKILKIACISFAENNSGKKPVSVFDVDNINFSREIDTILENYQSHPSILNIRNIRKHSGIY